MKVCIIISALVACTLAKEIEFFTTGNDYFDVDEVMKQPEKLKKDINCYLDKGPCDPLSQTYKNIMPEAIATACHRCNEAQKHLWNRFLLGLKQGYPEYYEAYQQKYDPKNLYLADLEKAVEGY